MLDFIANYFSFIGKVIAYAVETYLTKPIFFFEQALSNPISFEAIFAAFLLGVLVCLALGLLRSIIARDAQALIGTVEWYIRFFGKLGGYIIIILICVMVYEVISRYVFRAPTFWVFEAAYMLMGTSFMFAVAYCLQMRQHVRVDFIYDNLGMKGRAIVDLTGYLLFLVPMGLWLSAGLWDYFNEAYRVNETSGESAWNPIIWPFRFAPVVGFILLMLQVFTEILKCVLVLLGRDEPAATVSEAH